MISNSTVIDGQYPFFCQEIVIGNHRCSPSECVLAENMLTIYASKLSDPDEIVPLQLKLSIIVKIVFNMDLVTPVIFVYVLPSEGAYVRQTMGMMDQNGITFDPMALHHRMLGRILLVIDRKEDRSRIKSLESGLVEVFPRFKRETLELMHVESILKNYIEFQLIENVGLKNVSKQDTSRNKADLSRVILTYPPNAVKGRVTINVKDYCDLSAEEYLNDAIIDFYIKYLVTELLGEEERAKIHVYDSFFYKRLVTPMEVENEGPKQRLTNEEKSRISYERVVKWDEKVDIFSKDFIFIPINQSEHWFLAVICFPRLYGPVHFDNEFPIDITYDKTSKIKQPCILIFDSMGYERSHVISRLRNYLTERYRAENRVPEHEFTSATMRGHNVKAPQQQNYYDCGLFLLEYVQSLLFEPIQDFRIPIKLNNWEDVPSKVFRKREEIAKLVAHLMEIYEPEKLPLPEINLPTINGEPVVDDLTMESDEKEVIPTSTKKLNKIRCDAVDIDASNIIQRKPRACSTRNRSYINQQLQLQSRQRSRSPNTVVIDDSNSPTDEY